MTNPLSIKKIVLLYLLFLPLAVSAFIDERVPFGIDTYSPSDLYSNPAVGGGPQPADYSIYSNPPSLTEDSYRSNGIFSSPPAPTTGIYSNPPTLTPGIYSRGSGAGSVTISNPLAGVAEDLPGLIAYLLRVARILASAIAVLVIVYGGYQILFAAGDPRKFQIGIKTIVYAFIGLAVILLGDIIVSILREIVR